MCRLPSSYYSSSLQQLSPDTDGANREHRHRDVETGARSIGRRTYKPRSEVSRSYCRLGEALWVSLILAIWPKGRRMKEKEEEEDFRGKNVTVEAKHYCTVEGWKEKFSRSFPPPNSRFFRWYV